ncbi:hypothetical protein BY996DRAFT_6487108 [Phakopsora pachyrhizi]|nr:hypothetical protein BY996DRAFT_6487108 [Phakopsora pachyrhizi]
MSGYDGRPTNRDKNVGLNEDQIQWIVVSRGDLLAEVYPEVSKWMEAQTDRLGYDLRGWEPVDKPIKKIKSKSHRDFHKSGQSSVILTSSTKKVRRKSSSNNGTINGNSLTTGTSECSFNLNYKRLTKLISDLEPFEPYWSTIKVINTSSRRLDSVIRLKEILPLDPVKESRTSKWVKYWVYALKVLDKRHTQKEKKGMDKKILETEPNGGNVASSSGTSSSKVIDILEPDVAKEETGVTHDEFSVESSCLLSEEEEEQKEDNKENGKDDNEGDYEDCYGRIDAQAAQKFKPNSRVASQSGQEKEQLPEFCHPKAQVHLLKDNDDPQATEKINENKKNSRVKIKDKILFKKLPKLNMDENSCLRDELENESLNDFERASSRQWLQKTKKSSLSFIKRGGIGGEEEVFIFKRIKVENLDKSYFEFDRIESSLNRPMEDFDADNKPELFILPKMMIHHQLQTLFKFNSGRVVHIGRLRIEFINEVNCQRMIEFDWRKGWSKQISQLKSQLGSTCDKIFLVELGAQSINDGFDRWALKIFKS